MNCPTCNVQLLMTERLGTQIDYCPQCRGIWLEKGKLERIIERSSAEMQPRSAPQVYDAPPVRRDEGYHDKHHDKHHDGHHGEHRKGRGFLHDLFD